ncbi:MAG: Ig-like domain-containing protein [Clostridia bacterium]|nr:Ig-like domain-containing protein [Clostridia bacterium]
MKIFKKLSCIIMAFTLSMAFVGCGDTTDNPPDVTNPPIEQTKKLATPQNVYVSDTGLITWSAVENAEQYVVVLNGHGYRTSTTSYQVGSVVNDFTYAVYAVAKGYDNSAATETKTFVGKGLPIVVDPFIENLTVSISGSQLVGSRKETVLSATVNYPDGSTSKDIVWSIEDGEEYATLDQDGKFTANEVTEDHDVTVRATSVENEEKFAELVICVALKPVLTDEMLATVKDDYISFEGYMDIDLYTFGLSERFVRTVNIYGISTQMKVDEENGDSWHASYVDNSGYTASINYRKIDGIAQQVAVSLMNEEEYYPMTDEAGNPVSWEEAGLYNNFKGLNASDFEFNEDDWRYYYKGRGNETAQKLIASASPYDFDVSRFGLIIENGEILGIYAESNASLTVVEGYKAVEKFYSYINCGEGNVEVPEISKYEHNPMTTDGGHIDHDTLQTAIENMRALETYKLDVKLSSHMATGYSVGGFIETVTDGDYFFEPYDGNETITMKPNAQYGFHRVSEDVYNSYNYDAENDRYVAARAFDGDMNNAKASFAFAPEIFTSYAKSTFKGEPADVYFVDEVMSYVASTFYYGVGNDWPLYGLFAMRYNMLADYTPFVVVQNGYIVQTGFFYFLGDMYGEMVVSYSDFDTAEMPDTFKSELFEDGNYVPRTPPASWAELTVIDETYGGNDAEVNALDYFTEMFGEEGVKDLPFFGEILGDTFGFALANYRKPGGTTMQVPTVTLYYDVPLEADRTIDRTIKSAQEYLVRLGFVKNQYGEYVKGSVSAMPVDSSLDFCIYIWKTV